MTSNIDRTFKAFADPTRLRILHLLKRRQSLCVCDIMQIMKLPQPLISRHLAYLKASGLVEDRKQGLWRYYSLSKPRSAFQNQILKCLDFCFEELPQFKKDRAALQRRARSC